MHGGCTHAERQRQTWCNTPAIRCTSRHWGDVHARSMERRTLQLRVTEEARSGWDRLATEERVTMTALVEAIGLDLAEGRTVVPGRTIRRAASIDRARSSRRS